MLTSAQAQALVPADTLIRNPSLSSAQRTFITPIQWWQHFSYSHPSMNCQFEPSCSNFMAEAIQQKGILPGLVIGTDRIVRCNPAARHYHLRKEHPEILEDGRLKEPVHWQKQPFPDKNPYLAVSLSIMPGLGRAYAGHTWDGVFSFLLVGGFGLNTCSSIQKDRPVATLIYGTFTAIFWLADMYGAYRTASQTRH